MAWVIIPAYQPEKDMISIAEQMWECGCRLIVVDDGSGEGFDEIFEAVSDICVILRHPENRGKGAAIKTALAYIEEKRTYRDVIGIMDADGQHLPEDMIRLLEVAGDSAKTMVLGVRSVGQKMPLRSRLGNEITRSVFQLVSGVRVSDTQTGLRAFGTELIPRLLEIEGDRYEYEMNVLLTMAREKTHIEEVRIKTIYKDDDNSTSHFRTVLDSLRIYKDIIKFTFSSMSSFVIDYLLFGLFMLIFPHTVMWILGGNILARMVSSYYNYSMNCKYVFRTEKAARTAVDYFLLAGFILVMNNVILESFVQVLRIPVYPAKLLTECLLFLISWTVQKHMIFKKDRTPVLGVKKEAGL
ncbi:bifunctional glycosyltransferase family 2/GtrA family protein [Blautia sp. MSJ-19]|uniref:bifunctional glycosyltransferase family 2/GtrA family protein n=1 Tax=Blautia sp. MSJ-19 TaxID=2841517 RepID=UPI001C0F1C17|nr:bifunctional glycosyltransferase family 2/GtrA family protein [Blautia sp. MSJ-19]